MRLLLLHDRGAVGGGADRAALEAARVMAARGHDVQVALGDGPEGIAPAWGEALGPRAVHCLGPRVDSPGQARRARRLLAPALEPAPDWVVVSELLNPLLPGPLPAATRVAKWLHAHGETCPTSVRLRPDGTPCEVPPGLVCIRAGCVSPGPYTGLWPIVRRRWLLRGLRRADRLLVASRAMERLVVGLGAAPERVRRVPYPLSAPPRPPAPLPAEPRAMVPGRLVPAKGILEFARAFVGLGPELEVVGDGPERGALAHLAEGSGGRLRLAGWLQGEALEAAFARAALVVVPSLWPEPYGLVGPEALLRGRPVLATTVGGLEDWAGPGVVSRPPEPAGLAREAAGLLSDRPRLEALAAEARARGFPGQSPQDFGAALEEALGPP